MVSLRHTGLVAGIALIATAACGRSRTSANGLDAGLQSDLAQAGASSLELAPKAGQQVVVSPIEGGPQSAPAPTAHRTQRPVQQPRRQATVTRRIAPPQPAPAPRQVQAESPAPSAAPAPQPQRRQPGVYSTEADVFRQMPWIRP